MQRTGIEYLTHTWNPLAMRCTPISEGCAHCWHIAMTKRHAANPHFTEDERAAYAGHNIVLREKELEAPLKLRRPARIGVQFMGDLFLEGVGNNLQQKVWSVMERCLRHTFVVLTKRPQLMLEFVSDHCAIQAPSGERGVSVPYNIWLGTSIEKPEYGYRAEYLRRCPAAVRLLSIEPLLASLDGMPGIYDGMDLVAVGAETGAGARWMDPQWAREALAQCHRAGGLFFMKQMSNKEPIPADLMVREWPEPGEVLCTGS